MKLIHKGLILISVPLAFEVFFILGFGNLLQKSIQQIELEVHAKEVVACVDKIQVDLTETTSITALPPSYRTADSRPRYDALWNQIMVNCKTLKSLVGEKREQRQNLGALARQLRTVRRIQRMVWQLPPEAMKAQISSLKESSQFSPAAMKYWMDQRKYQDFNPFWQIADTEFKSIKHGDKLRGEIEQHFKSFILFGILANLAIAAGLAIFFGRNIEKRFANLMENTSRLNTDSNLNPPLAGSDEIAKLDIVLHEASSKLLEMQRFKKQLLGIVCHELKAPLSAVQALLSLLSNGTYGELNEKVKSAVQRAENNSERLKRMVTNLLDLEILGVGKNKPEFRRTDIDEILQHSADMVKTLVEDHHISLEISHCHRSLSVDPDRLMQVIINLLSNAIKYSPEGSTIKVKTREVDNNLELAVEDQGSGIPEEMHKTVFEAFQQGDQPQKAAIKGTGLGLAICKSIIEEHGGSIGVRSNPEQGCTFWIRLPMNETARRGIDLAAKEKEVLPQKKERMTMRFRHKGLLLIGLPFATELIFVIMLSALLINANHDIERQSNSREILATAEQAVQCFIDAELLISIRDYSDAKEVDSSYKQANERFDTLIIKLKELAGKDKERLALVTQLENTVKELNALHQELLMLRLQKSTEVNGIPEDRIKLYCKHRQDLAGEVDKITSHENALQSNFHQEAKIIKEHINNVLLFGLAINFLTALFLILFLSRDITKRINNVISNAKRMLAKQPLLPPLKGSDEIGQLDQFFHFTAKHLEEEQLLKQRLVAIASHELRTPLTAMKNSLELLSSGALGNLPDQARERILITEAGTSRLIGLINDLLDIEKMEAGKFTMNIQAISARSLAESAISSLESSARQKNILLDNQVETVRIEADPERLIQVLENLIANAIKFSPEGKAVIISSHKDNDALVICVQDFGIGIPGETHAKIFEPFENLDSGKEINATGSGLGLAVSKALVEQHGGTIGVDSFPGHGATFWVKLRLANG